MPTILHIETSTDSCSVALSCDGELIYDEVCYEVNSHAAKLPVFVQHTLDFARQKQLKIDAVAVSAGPGSYTGLRIGVSTAKGLCYGCDARLIAVDTLQLIATAVSAESDMLVCPMIDARRMEVYTALFDHNGIRVAENEAKIIDEGTFADLLRDKKIIFCGNGSNKCQNVITAPNAQFVADIKPLAKNMIRLAETKFANNEFEDVAYFEPHYLKEFQPTQKKVEK